MGLRETQSLLARLYVDSDLRERFFADPAALGAESGLSAAESVELAGLSLRQTEFFARALKFKRLNEVRRLLPRTAEAMARGFTEQFLSYAERAIPGGISKHQHDALGFAAHLQRADVRMEPVWAGELARYEAAWLQAQRRRLCVVVRFFGCDLRPMLHRPSGATAAVPRRLMVGFWLRLWPWGRIRHGLVPAGVRTKFSAESSQLARTVEQAAGR